MSVYCTSFASEHIYEFAFPALTKTSAERARVHQWTNLGNAQFKGGIKIPAYGISIENPVNDGLLNDFIVCRPKACRFNFKLNQVDAQQLAAYQVGCMGWFLAPRNWETVEADQGANGSARLLMLSPDQQQYLSFSDTSACAGCSLTAASLFFKSAQQEAKNNEFWVYSSSNVALKKVPLNSHTVLYSYQLPRRYPSDGVAKFSGIDSDIVNFNQAIVSLKPADKALSRAMLNFYLATH